MRHYHHYTIGWLCCLASLIIGFFVPGLFGAIVGTIGLVGWILLGAERVSRSRWMNEIPLSWFWSGVIFLVSTIIVHSGIYLVFESTPITLTLSCLLLTILTYFLPRAEIVSFHRMKNEVSIIFHNIRTGFWHNRLAVFLAGLIVACDVILLATVIGGKTTDTLQSPWLVVSAWWFILYAVTTGLLLFFHYQYASDRTYPIILTIIHFFLTLSIVSFVYPLGFGYDPFLHRATEEHIVHFGAAFPKTPFYIGQYSLVHLIVAATHLPLKLVDIWLVSVIASVLIPLAAYTGLGFGTKVSNRFAHIGPILILLYPAQTFIVTTPHNLANVFLLTAIFLSLLSRDHKYWLFPALLIALASAVTHPLSGILAILFIFIISIKNRFVSTLLFFGMTISTTVLFGIYFFLQGKILPALHDVITNNDKFLRLWETPYYVNPNKVSWPFELVYTYQWAIVLCIVVVALLGAWKNRSQVFWYLMAPIAILLNTFLTSTLVVIPELSSFEQIQYAERLLHITPFFLLPLFILGYFSVYKWVKHRLGFVGIGVLFLGTTVCLMVSLYLTYPQLNPKVFFPGFNVTAADVAVSDWIHDTHPSETPYVVLSNIMTTAASVEKYGFAKYYSTPMGELFYYSIPSGSPFYTLFEQMLYQRQTRDTMENAMDLANVDEAYFILHSYWGGSNGIAEGAKKTADSWRVFTDGNVRILVFTYRRGDGNKE